MKLQELLNGLKTRDPQIMGVLGQVYNSDVTDHLTRVLVTFSERFPAEREVSVLRSPGRVNLIGEHTDYNGLPVLPMAIDHDILVVYSPREDRTVKIVNPEFPDRSFEIQPVIPHYETGDWGNYVKAGVQGVVNELAGVEGLRGFNACFYGTVPASAGLSSSSSLVVASGMVLLEASGRQIDPLALAECMARAEWYSGIECGAMDHAVAIFGERGKALKIDFFPLRIYPTVIPPGYTVVVANTMVEAAKTLNARMQYNTRHAVCRMATALLVKRLALESGNVLRLGDIYYLLGRDKLLLALKTHLKWHGYTKSELAENLGITLEELEERFCTTTDGEQIHEPPCGFKLLSRARHVVTEAARVEDSLEAIQAGEGARFGALMNASYESCRNDYEISHPAIDDLVAIALEAGSAGSRLTGAGFGGCTVNLVPDDRLADFQVEVLRRYYKDAIKSYPEAFLRYREKVSPAMLTLKPAGGARLLFE